MQVIFVILGSLLLLGVCYEFYARYKAKKTYPIAGEFVDIGGYKLHYIKKGSGDATIIFESGADFGGHVIWNNIQEKLSQKFTTLSYDRAGTMHSERGDNPKACASMAKELHDLLEQLDLPKPYIIVGHSLAGLILRCFMRKYGQDVVGLVLLDPTHPDALEAFPKKVQKMYTTFPPKWLMSLMLPFGVLRLMFIKLIAMFSKDAQVSEKENIKEALAYIHKGFKAYAEEFAGWRALSQEAKGLEFDTVSIVLLGATKSPVDDEAHHEAMEIMTRLHHDTVKKSPYGKYIAVESAHTIQFEKPDLVVETVEEFVEEILKV
jgi:pimeloyl-ACP methyl ester carboxylesterase